MCNTAPIDPVIQTMKILVEYRVDLNDSENVDLTDRDNVPEETPLPLAALYGKVEVVELLLQINARLDLCD
jgi:ankyrin repeat protein